MLSNRHDLYQNSEMSKTAEEILHEHMSGKDIDELPNAGVSALREFAAQEVEEYKSKLRKILRARYKLFNSEIKPSDRDQAFDSAMFEIENSIELIDTVK